jgi:hypothetical protein
MTSNSDEGPRIRRIATGQAADGRAIIASDE